ncbi:hypothetical protein HYV56_02385 [Candidatus Peregrinibacteria bacterium]|nr:hypothetical protein [Candidatus Peregrinibacteria bacterium]
MQQLSEGRRLVKNSAAFFEDGKVSGESDKSPETIILGHFCRNVRKAAALEEMRSFIEAFADRFVRLIIKKCIDGRVHGTHSKGIPIGCPGVTLRRADGARFDSTHSNPLFWTELHDLLSQTLLGLSSKPPLLMALAHTSILSHSCAAHATAEDGSKRSSTETDKSALETVSTLIQTVRRQLSDRVVGIFGITNTDDNSHDFYFPNGNIQKSSRFSVSGFIESLGLSSPHEVFQDSFLDSEIIYPQPVEYARGKTRRQLFDDGSNFPFFRDFKVAIESENELLGLLARNVEEERNDVLVDEVFNQILEFLKNLTNFPQTLHGPVLYMIAYNIAFTLYKRVRLTNMSYDEREAFLGHSEEIICYGDGFQTLGRNEALLVKHGRGNDLIALEVARNVLAGNRGNEQDHDPIVHINHEHPELIVSFEAYTRVLAEIATMVACVKEVFGDNVRIITSYSYKNQKMFYPVSIPIYEADGLNLPVKLVGVEITSRSSIESLRADEARYANEMLEYCSSE